MESYETALAQYRQLQEQNPKGLLHYVYISLLNTGLVMCDPWFQIDLLDKRSWGDVAECYRDWDLGSTVTLAYAQMHAFKTPEEADNYQYVLRYTQDIISTALEWVRAKHLIRQDGAEWYLGEYMATYHRI